MKLSDFSQKVDAISRVIDTIKYVNDYRTNFEYTVEVNSNDSTLYRATQGWLVQNLSAEKVRHLVFETESHSLSDYLSDEPKKKVGLSKKATRLNHVVIVGGHKVRVRDYIQEAHQPDTLSGSFTAARARAPRQDQKIIFVCKSLSAQQAVESLLESIIFEYRKKTPTLYTANSWNNWDSRDLRGRGLKSVILPDGRDTDLKEDLQDFLESEEKYVSLGLPYKRGYLFEGIPGSGKSSLAKALASEFNLDIWYAPLGDMKEDSTFTEMISGVKENGILLLEDIDTFSNVIGRESNELGKTGMGTLLNILDGILSPHGLIVIMTTNHLQSLDPALTRPGRADRIIHFEYPTLSEVERFYSFFFPDRRIDLSKIESGGSLSVSQAQISEVLKSNWKDPVAAEKELIQILLQERCDPSWI